MGYIEIAPYACNVKNFRGRVYNDEIPDNTESAFLEDRERIVCSIAFRRLQYKTQVFVNSTGDHYRTRLTHSLEVAIVAKNISRIMALNEDLSEVMALAHDLGHPPFGHAGEDTLSKAMHQYGGFNHNFQTIKIITLLESRYFDFPGLNLTLDVIDGLIKHNGPLKENNLFKRNVERLFNNIDLRLNQYPSLEAQVASMADDIAYCTHDIDDGIRAGFLSIEDLLEVDIFANTYESIKTQHHALSGDTLNSSVIRRIRQLMINDLIATTKENLRRNNIEDYSNVLEAKEALVNHSEFIQNAIIQFKSLLMKKVYRHEKLNEMRQMSDTVITFLFNFFMNSPDKLPQQWHDKLQGMDEARTAIVICDYIAGMTDRFALKEYDRLTI